MPVARVSHLTRSGRAPLAGRRDVEPTPTGAREPITAHRAKAAARTRTGDPFITSEVLYQLSYGGGVGAS
jgi:hypothetical protein